MTGTARDTRDQGTPTAASVLPSPVACGSAPRAPFSFSYAYIYAYVGGELFMGLPLGGATRAR